MSKFDTAFCTFDSILHVVLINMKYAELLQVNFKMTYI